MIKYSSYDLGTKSKNIYALLKAHRLFFILPPTILVFLALLLGFANWRAIKDYSIAFQVLNTQPLWGTIGFVYIMIIALVFINANRRSYWHFEITPESINFYSKRSGELKLVKKILKSRIHQIVDLQGKLHMYHSKEDFGGLPRCELVGDHSAEDKLKVSLELAQKGYLVETVRRL